MIRHLILIKSAHLDQIDALLETLPPLVGQIPGLVGVEHHANFSERSQGYDRFFILDFDSRESLGQLAAHPLHDPIRDALGAAKAEIIVFDYEV